MDHVAEQSSWAPLPSCSPPRRTFPIKSLALSAHVSPWTTHFQVLDKSPLLALEGIPLPATSGHSQCLHPAGGPWSEGLSRREVRSEKQLQDPLHAQVPGPPPPSAPLTLALWLLGLCPGHSQPEDPEQGPSNQRPQLWRLHPQGPAEFELSGLQVLAAQSCPTLCNPMVCPWDSPGKDTGEGCHSLLQGNLPDPGSEPGSPALQADSSLSELRGKLELKVGLFRGSNGNNVRLYFFVLQNHCRW